MTILVGCRTALVACLMLIAYLFIISIHILNTPGSRTVNIRVFSQAIRLRTEEDLRQADHRRQRRRDHKAGRREGLDTANRAPVRIPRRQ